MSALLSLLLPLMLLGGIYAVLRGRHRPTFRPASADARFGSLQGPLAATWLALVAATWGVLDVAGRGWPPVPPSVIATLMLAVIVGLVVAQRATLFVLATLGLLAQFVGIAADHGVAAAVGLIAVTGLATWLFGAARGLLTPRAGAGRLVVGGLVLVVVLQLVGSTWSAPAATPSMSVPAGGAR
ncbi:hypothetical protein [uncultured Pseudonocardia sp.]|uniref:hypothetical protein n=1 Tax=uncultured Pseudonocardia sp. TaxID=211455 RepID=UPI0026143AA5|nr:hypothetical protein [uncultured Pseudonocardia sp.]